MAQNNTAFSECIFDVTDEEQDWLTNEFQNPAEGYYGGRAT